MLEINPTTGLRACHARELRRLRCGSGASPSAPTTTAPQHCQDTIVTPSSDVADSTDGNPESAAGSGEAEAQPLWTQPIAFSRWIAEAVDFEYIGMNSGNPQPTELMIFCCAMLGTAAPDPEKVCFVVTGDFEESVKQRLPEGEYRDSFDTQRGAGMVAAKTLKVSDEIHVVFPQWMFVDTEAALRILEPEEAAKIASTEAERAQHVRRTAFHEAQHVAIAQRGEDTVDLDGLGWASKNFVSVAAQIIEEYRAELAVPRELREEHELVFPVDALEHLRADLTRITTVEYQQHLDVGKLSYDVVQQTHHVWKVLAYLVAARRVFGIVPSTAIPADVQRKEAWRLMAAPLWERFEALLSEIPPGQISVSPKALHRCAIELADLLSEWVRLLGFRWDDIGDPADQNSQFSIESWGLFE